MWKKKNDKQIWAIVLVSAVVHLAAMLITEGHPTDIGCFKGWADKLFTGGLSNFYISEGFTDYPPGYMYVLYLIGMIRSVFGLDYGGHAYLFLVKLPAMAADIVSGIFIYKLAKRRIGERQAFVIAMFYAVNPVVVLNSAVWGQVDSIHTLLLVVSVYFIIEKKLLKSCLVYVVAVLVKPQSFMFAPIYLYVFFMFLKERKFSGKAFAELLKYGGISLALLAALILPFAYYGDGYPNFMPVFDQYVSTLASYNYTTVNAYNIYGLFGLNWKPLDMLFLGIPFSVWGTIALIGVVVFAFILLKRADTPSNYFYVAAVITMCTFVFSVKMHERYCYPALLFLLAAYVYRRDKRILYVFAAFTLTFFIHYTDVLAMSINDFNYPQIENTMRYFSFLMLLSFAFMMVQTFRIYDKNRLLDSQLQTADSGTELKESGLYEWLKVDGGGRQGFYRESRMGEPYGRTDWIFLAGITVVYAIIAFSRLGDMSAAQTPWVTGYDDYAVADLGSVYNLSRVQFMPNGKHDQEFVLGFSTDGVNFPMEMQITENSVFNWEQVSVPFDARYVLIRSKTEQFRINEMAFRSDTDELISVVGISGNQDASRLFDEQELVPDSRLYMNSTYFDEIYHARTAYEVLNGLEMYEWTHPPLGKLIMSVGISIFGMTPFGWRFMGTLFGVLMVPAIYAFARKVFGGKWDGIRFAAFATILFTFDFMHYAQTRLATIDTYITFFVILMYYFMFKYCDMNYNDKETKFTKTLIPLGLSGVCMGLGVASKWPGVYAGIGLAILFFAHLCGRLNEYYRAVHAPSAVNAYIRRNFKKHTLITLLMCVVFFVIIPACIYFASYMPWYFGDHNYYPVRESIPFLVSNDLLDKWPDNKAANFIATVISEQFRIFDYHARSVVGSTHAYASEWWKWPFSIRPIFYWSNTVSDNVKQGISSFGNPAVWFFGFAAFIVTSACAVINKARIPAFLAVAYLVQFVPWMLVSRTTYIYHYFPCVPFLVIMTAYCLKTYTYDKGVLGKYSFAPVYALAGVTVVLFVMFYPVLTGTPVSVWYVKYVLRWLPSWQLIL